MVTMDFFKNLSSHKEELATLLTENFEITGKSFSQTWFVWIYLRCAEFMDIIFSDIFYRQDTGDIIVSFDT